MPQAVIDMQAGREPKLASLADEHDESYGAERIRRRKGRMKRLDTNRCASRILYGFAVVLSEHILVISHEVQEPQDDSCVTTSFQFLSCAQGRRVF